MAALSAQLGGRCESAKDCGTNVWHDASSPQVIVIRIAFILFPCPRSASRGGARVAQVDTVGAREYSMRPSRMRVTGDLDGLVVTIPAEQA